MLSGVFFLLRFWKSGSMIDKTSLVSRFFNADGYAVTGEGGVLGYNIFA